MFSSRMSFIGAAQPTTPAAEPMILTINTALSPGNLVMLLPVCGNVIVALTGAMVILQMW